MNGRRAAGLRARVRASRADSGFTLIEVVFAIVLSALIAGVVAAGLVTALNVSRSTTAQVADSNDAGLISSFLIRDAQSAGGIDPTTALPDNTLGVSTNPSDADGIACTPTPSLLRLSWIDRSTPAAANKIVVTYVLSNGQLTRRICATSNPTVDVVLGRNLSTATATCLPVTTFCAGHPTSVSLTLSGKGARAPLNYTLTASLRSAASLLTIVSPSALLPARLGIAYASPAMATIGGSARTTWSATGLTGTGLSIDPWSGMIWGTPNPTGSFPVTATVTVIVTDPAYATTATRVYAIIIHAPPVATSDGLLADGLTADPKYSVNEDTTLSVALPGVLANDTHLEGATFTATLASGAAHGRLVLNATGAFTYTPDPNWNGTDSFKYRANDGLLDSALATVTLTVAPVNDPPVNQVPVTQETPMNTPEVFSNSNKRISISDIDAGASPVKVQLTGTNGTITLPGTTGLMSSTGSGTATMTVIGTVANINLSLVNATFTPTHDFTGAATLTILTNDQGNTGSGGAKSDMDSVTINVTNNSLGDLTTSQDIGDSKKAGSCEYSDGTYTVSAGQGLVTGTSDKFQFCFRQLTGDGTLTAKVVSFDANGPGDAQAGVMFRETLDPDITHAMVDLTGNGGEFLFRNGKGTTTTFVQNGSLRVPQWMRLTRVGNLFTAEWSSDGATWILAGKQTIAMAKTVYVGLAVSAHANNVDSAQFDQVAISTTPIAADDSYSVNQYGTLTVPAVTGVLANDSDPKSNGLTANLVSGTAGLKLSPDGSFTYVPPVNLSGTARFTYTANDGSLTSAPATVTITVNPGSPVNAVPSFTKGADQIIRTNLGAQTVPGWATAISAGAGDTGQLVDFVVTNTNNSMFSVQPSISADGTLTYASAPADVLTGVGASGTATLSVFIHDNGGTANGGMDTSAIQTFTIRIVSR